MFNCRAYNIYQINLINCPILHMGGYDFMMFVSVSPVGCGVHHQTAGQRDGQCVHGHCDSLQHPGAELLRHTGTTTPAELFHFISLSSGEISMVDSCHVDVIAITILLVM